MGTVVVGDTHLKQRQILPRVDAAIDKAAAERVVFLGDYCDDWGAADAFALGALRVFSSWVSERRARGISIDVLLGNHDLRYLMGEDGSGIQWGIMDEVRGILEGLGLSMAAEAGGYLLTHAGVTSAWAHENLPECDASHYTAEDVARSLNDMFSDRKRWRDLDACGAGRGGFDTAGPLWADVRELSMDYLPDVNQVVGHTPVFSCERVKLWPAHSSGMRMWHSMDGREGVRRGDDSIPPVVWACDTFSLTSMLAPVGDGSMLYIGDDGAVEVLGCDDLGICDWRESAMRYFESR